MAQTYAAPLRWNETARRAAGKAGGQRGAKVNSARGIMMLLAAAVAVWKGLHVHRGPTALLAFGLAALALGMAVWHLTRPSSQRRI